MYLSKSKYCNGLQCPKILWMDKNMPQQKAQQDDSRMIIGNMVGDLAMDYFGEFVEVSFDRQNMSGMISETKRLLDEGTNVITEATFTYNGNFCSVDILRKVENGYEIIEVKSASGTAEDDGADLMKRYGDDLAYQHYVLTHCGLNITKVSLMRLNKGYVRSGELDLKKLFVITDCTEQIPTWQDTIESNIRDIIAVAQLTDEPKVPIGSRCKGCAYAGWCLRELPENNVFDIGWYMRSSKKDDAYERGYITFQEIYDSPISLNEKQLLQVKTVVNNLPPHIEPYSIRQFLNGLTYPLYHLDFETYQQPIPLWNGVKPYQQIPFQYSLHIQDKPCAEPIHREFLGKEGVDPRWELAQRLCADIPLNACVLAYNASFEKTRIYELAELFPNLAEHLMNIHANIKDLADPFSKGYYYCREMGGSYSIKSVLPALCGDDSELDYHKLDIIHNGGEAMNAYATLHEQPPEEIEKIRAALLEYCRLDTLAMVRVLGRLYEGAGVVGVM